MRRRRWLDHQRFLDLLSATNLIPGPNSTEMAIHLGRLRAGWPGLIVGGAAFILPSALLTTAFAALYDAFGQTPLVEPVMQALRPAVLVVIIQALVHFARSALWDPWLGLVAAAALGSVLSGVGEVLTVAAAAALGFGVAGVSRARARAVPLLELAWVAFKIGATLFGSGYVLVTYLEAEVSARGWLSNLVVLDAIAIGQVTPGPVSTAVTFVGYLVAGVPGAVVATVMVFLPAFVLVAATGPLVERWREHPTARRVLDVVNAAVVGLIAAAVVRLAPPLGAVTPLDLLVGTYAATALWWLGWSSTRVLVGAAAGGALLVVIHVLDGFLAS